MKTGDQLGVYRVTGQLGAGGMGEVYRAEDTRLKREVAIKVLPEALAADPQRLGRLEREAQVLASLNHPRIAAIYGLEEAAGARALVLELVDGPTLEEKLAKAGKLPLDEALSIALQITEALEAAHDKGIVHRDLKPANVKVPEGEGGVPEVKVLDFGLAKATGLAVDEASPGDGTDPDAPADSPTLSLAATQAGLILGTAAYMSPEQAKGKPADRRADIWAFGCVLYEMIAGRRVFDGETVSEVLAAVILQEVAWDALPGDVPLPIRTLLERCLTRDARRRLRDIGEARLALDDYLADPDASRSGMLGAAPGQAATEAESAVAAGTDRGSAEPSGPFAGWLRVAAAFVLGAGAVYAITNLWFRAEPAEVTRLRVSLVEIADSSDEDAVQGRLDVAAGSAIAISPDGRQIAYVTAAGGRYRLWGRVLDNLDPALLAEGAIRHPFFSADGGWVGFFDDDSLRKVSFSGGSSARLADAQENSRGGSWGDDGFIVFSPGTEHPVFRVPDSGGEAVAITTLDEDAGQRAHRFPDVLPGGKVIVYTAGVPGSFQDAVIRAVDLETGRDVELVGGMYARYLSSGHLAYLVEGTLFVIPFDADALAITGRPTPAVDRVAFNYGNAGAQYAVSSSGALAYIEGGVASVDIQPLLSSELDGVGTVIAPPDSYRDPRVSPDGSRLAVTIGEQTQSDLHVRDLSTGAQTRLTFDSSAIQSPVWSPDSRYLYYSSLRQGSRSGPTGTSIWRKRADGVGEEEQISLGATDAPLDVAPDGSALLMRRAGSNALDLWILRLQDDEAEGEPEAFVSAPSNQSSARFSPDGSWVAYESNEGGRGFNVFVTSYPDAAGKWQLSTVQGRFPLWSPDGRTVYYQASGEILAVDLTIEGDALSPSSPRMVFSGPYTVAGGLGSNWDMHPEGDRFILKVQALQTTGEAPPVFVLNWLEEVRRFER